MSIKITSVKEAIEDNGLKILVHGQAGSGKTVFCATTGEETLIISAEGGLLSIAHAPENIKTTVVKTIDELEQAYFYLENNPGLFKWVCIDSISEIAEVLLSDEKEGSRDPRQAYGNLQDRMSKILRSFRDLRNMNVVMTCKQQRQVDEDTNRTRFVPLMPGKGLTNSIPYLFDEVFALRVEKDEDGEDYRIIQTGRDRNYEAKDRSGLLDLFEEPSVRKIALKIREGGEEVEEEVEEVEETKENQEVEENEISEENSNDSATEVEVEEKETVDSENSESDETHDEDEDIKIIEATEKTLYLYHHPSESVMKLEIGEEIEDDGEIEQIDYKEYLRIKNKNS